jgi:hypothetical protein
MKDKNTQLAQLVEQIETVEQWSHGPQVKEHIAWLDRSIAWDIVAVVTMSWAAQEVDEPERVEGLLRSGLAEVAAGPGDHVVSLVSRWKQALGPEARCRLSTASEEDVSWLRVRLSLPPPKGASTESQQTLAAYATRAGETRQVQRVDCGGAAHLLVGVLAERLVPILRE